MTPELPSSRRGFLRSTLAGTLLTGSLLTGTASLRQRLEAAENQPGLKGRIRHSVCKWCYPKISLEEMCVAGKQMGLSSVELLQPKDFPTLKAHGLECAMVAAPTVKGPDGKEIGGIGRAFNRTEYHDILAQIYPPHIEAVAEAGFKNLICFSGNREGLDDETGLKNCVEGLKRLLPLAEKKGVVLCMELLNSRVNHPDYMCDRSAWGVELCKRLGSNHFRLLYDIYHMQIMEGDIIATIQRDHPYFAHYHTGGVPGRHEIDATQELNYVPIMQAIAATGYQGHVGQEFLPVASDALASLRAAVTLCDV